MTEQEALQLAQRRWGEKAFVRHDPGTALERFVVGVRGARIFHVKGKGRTWEEAFKAADRKQQS
jgi:hypothetical protein